MEINVEVLKELAGAIQENNIRELILETKSGKVTLKRGEEAAAYIHPAPQVYSMPAASVQAKPAHAVKTEAKKEVEETDNYHVVASPMVGTFYKSPSPDAAAFVKEGDTVTKGQTLCIVEAMKLMNEVKADVSGKVVKIAAENGKHVKKGDKLFLIDV